MTESLQQLKERSLTFPEKASAIIIHNDETLKGANKFLLAIKGMIKEIVDAFKPMKQKTNEAHKAVVAQEKHYLEPLYRAEKSAKMQIGVYVRTIEAKVREAQRKADEAEAERLKKQAEIEANAQRFENHGHHREAEEIREKYVEPEIVKVPDAPSLNGIHLTKRLTFEIIDESLLPRLFLSVDKVKIRAYIKEHKEKAMGLTIPGLRIFYETSVSAKSGE